MNQLLRDTPPAAVTKLILASTKQTLKKTKPHPQN